MTLKQVKENFEGQVYRNENGTQKSYCVVYPNSKKVYTYNGIVNLESLNEILHKNDCWNNEFLETATFYNESTNEYFTQKVISEAN